MEDQYMKRIFAGIIVLALLVSAFFVMRPILLYVILGFVLAFIFSPIYDLLHKWTKWPNFSATIVSFILLVIVILPLWFLAPMAIDQSFKIYQATQKLDFVSTLQNVFPDLFASEQFSIELGSAVQTFLTGAINSLLDAFTKILLNIPTLFLYMMVVFFTFYFALRDKKEITEYLKALSPFSQTIERKLFSSSKEITKSVIYGQIVIGILQGLVITLGFFIFGVPNALVLSIVAIIAGMLPIVGPMFVWVPTMIYLLMVGDTFSSVGIFIFGIIASNIDNILRPLFVSRFSKMHSAIVLIGMIGGLFVFGIMGLILGPLILAYVLIILEVFRGRKVSGENTISLLKKE